MALLVAPAAFAQTPPADAPPAPAAEEVDTSIPGVTDAAPAEAPDAAPAPEAAPAAAEGEAAEVEDPFSVQHMWKTGDIVSRGVLIIMIIMFAGTIYVAATKLVEQGSLSGQLKRVGGFWEANSIDEGLDALGSKGAFRDIAEGAIQEANNPMAGLGSRIGRLDRTSHRVGIELERVNAKLQAGMAWLATVGAICPFVGLFGTVWGIVKALTTIGMTGDASIEKVAGPVGEALIMTAIGLAVAVPAVILYNALGRRNKGLSDGARHFAFDVEKLMSTSAKA
jgi:biopolymer transport protein ExbB